MALAFFDGGENRLGLVLRFDELARFDVLFGVVEGCEDHGFDLLVGEAVGRFHFDIGFLAAALLARADVRDAVGVDEELDFDAGQPATIGGMALRSKRAMTGSPWRVPRSLCKHVDGDVGLAVDAGGEVLGFALVAERGVRTASMALE